MKIVDKRGIWLTNFSQFRMHDPMSDTYFESGEPTKATDTQWRQANKAIIKRTDEDGTEIDDPDVVVEADEPAKDPAPVKADPKK